MLTTGVPRYIGAFSRQYSFRPDSPEIRFLEFLLRELVRTRNARVEDLKSEEMGRARLIMERLLGFSLGALLPCLCIDGRVLVETVFGLSGTSFRTPAADISDALLMNGGGLRLIDGAFTAEILSRVKEYGKAVIILDSHSHCAAKGKEVLSAFGIPSPDHGLLEDVRRKKLITEAIREFANRTYGEEGGRKVMVIQTSFDVDRGFLFMGLEQESVLSESRVQAEGFVGTVLESLSREGKILSSELLSRVDNLLPLCEDASRRVGAIDFQERYGESMEKLWSFIDEAGRVANPIISREVGRLFDCGPDERRVRSALLLSNMLLGYLLNSKGVYPYSEHRESVVVVTKYARGSYGTAIPFPVNNGGGETLSSVVDFAASIVRDNRGKGRFSESEGRFISECFGEDSNSFVASPVAVLLSERVREDIPELIIQALVELDWERVSWADMSDGDLSGFLTDAVPGIPKGVIESVIRLRSRVLALYSPGLPATRNLLSGQLALVPSIRTEEGRIIAVLPFFLSGYSERYLETLATRG